MGKLLSQVDTEASVSPMMNILTEKKKKKNKKGKEHVEEPEVQEVASMESVGMSPKKKKKKKKKDDMKSQHEISEVVIEKPKKEKKKKKNKKLDESQNEASVHSNSSSRVNEEDLSTSADASSPSKSNKTAVESPNKKRMLENSTHNSTKKRKMRKSTEKFRSKTMSISEDINGGVLEPLPWSVEEEKMLLEKMEQQLPKKDTKSFRVTLKHLKWDEVAFGSRTAEDCRIQFMEIISKLNAMKSLTTMVQEAKERSVDYSSRKKRVLQPMHRFMRDAVNSGKLLQVKESGGKYLAAVHEAWRTLSVEEKEKYELEYNEELQRIGVSLKSLGVMNKVCKYKVQKEGLPRTPLEMWCFEQKNEIKGNSSAANNSKVVFAGLDDRVKLKYITSSLREMYDFEKKIGEQKESYPEDKVPQIRGPTKVDLKLYLNAKGLPEDQCTRPFTVFYQELREAGELDNIEGKDKLMSVMEKFRLLPEDRKLQYQIQALKNKKAYETKMAAWENNQDELTLYARQKFVKKKATKVLSKPAVRVKRKMPEVFSNVVHCDSTCPTFHDEPSSPPPTPFKLFCLKCEHSVKQEFETAAQKRSVLAKTWENFPNEKKFAYSRRCEELKEKYEERLIQYVQNMDKKMRKIYLGFRRQSVYSYFKRDIFQNYYPNEKYPVYELSPKKKKQKVASESDDDFVAEPVLASDKRIKEGKSKKNSAVEKSQSSTLFKRSENIASKTKKDAKRQLLGSSVSKLDGNNTKYKSKSHVTTSKSAEVAKCIRTNSPLIDSDSSNGNERKRKFLRNESLEEKMEHNKPSSRLSAKRTKPTIITNELESETDSDVDSDCSGVDIDKKQNSFDTSVEDSVSDDSDFKEDLVKTKPNKLSTEKTPSKKEKSIMTPMKLESDNSSDEESEEEIEIEKPKPNTFSSKGSPSKKKPELTLKKSESDESSDEGSESEEELEKPKKFASKGSPSNKKPELTLKKSESDESSYEESESEEEHEKTRLCKSSSKEVSVFTPQKLESDDSSDEKSDTEVGPAWKSSTSITNYQSSSSSDSN